MQFLLIFLALILANSAPAKALSMQEYLGQVQGQNQGYNAANKNDEGYKLLQRKAALVTAPTFFASADTGFVEQTPALIFARYNRVDTQNYSVGISQNSSFGLNTTLSYNLNKVKYQGLVTANPITASNYQTRPVLQIVVPLLQGRFGSLTRATRDSIDAQNEALKYSAQSLAASTIIMAEQNYWQLVAARRIVDIQKVAEKQAEKILEYVKKKEAMRLGETADILQARALVETKKLDLRQAQNDLQFAARNFNRYRYINSDEVPEKLENIDFPKIERQIISQIKPDSRPDVKAAKANMKAAIAAAKVEEENNKPNLSLYGTYALKGVEVTPNNAITHSLDNNGREALVGLKLSVPLYFGALIDVQQGAKLNAAAARGTYQQRVFDEAADWSNLLMQLAYFQERAGLAQEIEAAQKAKLENERKLLKQGRTSTYQVLLFEQDYCQSQINTVASANQFFNLVAQKKLYGEVK